jgi:hypothetical protein
VKIFSISRVRLAGTAENVSNTPLCWFDGFIEANNAATLLASAHHAGDVFADLVHAASRAAPSVGR